MTAHSRTMVQAAGGLAAALLLTGSVHAAPLAQFDLTPESIDGMTRLFGIGGTFLIAVLFLIYRIFSLKQPTTPIDIEKDELQLRQKEADNEAARMKLERDRFEAKEKDDTKRAEQFDRMLAQLEKDHERMHESEASHARMSADQLKVEQATEARLKSIEDRIVSIDTTLAVIKTATGTDSAQKLHIVEAALSKVVQDFSSLVGEFKGVLVELKPAPVPPVHVEVNNESVSSAAPAVSADTPTDPAPATGLSAGPDAAKPDASGHAG